MTINCKGELINLNVPKVMGILNVTPDSFYDGGKYKDEKGIIKQVAKMLTEGASFIDVGAYSSKPGAIHVSEEEELGRILPIIELLIREFPDILLSIDTFRSRIAKTCILAGAAIINDISAGKLDEKMLPTIAENKVPYIMMHMKGNPQTMQSLANYQNLLVELQYYFSERIAAATSLGISDLIIDAGFGFSKTIEQNFEVLKNLELFHNLNRPLLVGLSRKSMIYKTLEQNAKNALNGTTALHMYALTKGAHILRVHDVKEAVECVKLAENLM